MIKNNLKNEIVVYAQNYNLTDGIKAFIKGVVNQNLTKELIFLYKNVNPEVLNYLSSLNIRTYNTDLIDKRFNVNTSLSMYTLKTVYFYLYSKHISVADNLFLTDCTDVFFNKNPFDLVENKIKVFAENEFIGKCQTNLTWLVHCYNQELTSLLLKKLILNGGLFLGPRDKCVDLFQEMMVEVKEVIGRIGNYQNIDQAILNKVIYFGGVESVISSNSSVINFAHYSNKFPCKLEIKNNSIFIDGEEMHVLHQYNRVKPLEQKIYNLCLI